MLGGISGVGSYSTYYTNPYQRAYRTVTQGQGVSSPAEQAQNAQRSKGASNVWTARRPADLETPVQPVDAVKPVNANAEPAGIQLPIIREGADPAEMAVRMRITPYVEEDEASLPFADSGENGMSVEDAQKALEEGECETCEKRKYQDGSDDMSVSFQTPTNIKPEQVASAVRGHEMEHVVHEQAKAQREDRKVVSQSVTLHTDICPECGKVYISGGETQTVTKANPEQPSPQQEEENNKKNGVISAAA